MSAALPRRFANLLSLLLLVVAPPVHATITPDAAKVLDHYLTAIGGRQVFAAERTIHTKSTVLAFGFTGTVEAWAERPDHMASSTLLGPFTLKDGFDGTVAWRIDQNGKLTRRDGKDLENERGQAWFENDRWLDPDQGGGTIKVKSVAEDSTGSYTVLDVAPPVGRPHEMWFDNQTGLLAKVILQSDQQTVITRLTDYRSDHGRLRPYRQEGGVANMPANTIVSTIDSVWVNEPMDPSRFAMPSEAGAGDFKFLKGAGVAHLPMRYGERHVWLKVSVNGGPMEDFILDTGASVSLLDSAWAAAHGVKAEGRMQAMGAGAAGDVGFTRVGSLRVAGPDGDGVELSQQKVAVLALNRYTAPFFWRDAAGVLGYDFISRFVEEIDYDNGTLTLYDPKTFHYAGKGTGVPLTMSGSIPVVKATLDDQYEGDFRLDVGSGSTVDVHSPFVKKNGLHDKVGKTVEILNGGFGGTFSSTLGRMKKMQIGPYSWSDPLVILSGAETGGLASQDYAGNIGNEVLDRFKVTFDYEHRMLYLEPGKNYGKRDRFTLGGAQLARYGDQIQAMQVIPGSAADDAGLKEGDEVASLDGKPILTWTPDRIREVFESGPPGQRHTLVVVRDGKKVPLSIKLKAMI